MQFLVFKLQAPLSAWGDVAVGEVRGSYSYPSESAVLGLIGAALGVRRSDEHAHAALRDGYALTVGVVSHGTLLRDYHTIQVPGRGDLKGRPHYTRRDELSTDRLNTILSTRDYRQGASSLVAVSGRESAPYNLEFLAEALRTPKFILYLGRRSCPPAAPLYPRVLEAQSALLALQVYSTDYNEKLKAIAGTARELLEALGPIERLSWSGDEDSGVPTHLTAVRKDRLVHRRAWQFADRVENIALLQSEED